MKSGPISTAAEFLESIERCGDALRTRSVYRGQADARWRVDCSAARRLALTVGPTCGGHSLVAYTYDLLGGASRYVGACPELPRGYSELEILAQLQHHGAATGLIDFTTKPLVALWFACSGHQDEDGAVYVLSRVDVRNVDELEVQRDGVMKLFYGAGARNEQPYLWCPRKLRDGRPASQASVFVLGVPFLWPALLWKVVISKDAKRTLLEELQTKHDITEGTLFPDFGGYAHMNAVSKLFDAESITRFWRERVTLTYTSRGHVDRGIAYGELNEYGQAIEQFSAAIAVDKNEFRAFANRANAKLHRGDFDGAIADYTYAISKFEKAGDSNEQQIGRLYWDRGVAHHRLGQTEQAREDYNRAIKLKHKMYVSESDERIVSHPPNNLKYRG